MTYYLNQELKKVISPVVVKMDGGEMTFRNGAELCAHSFSKPYTVNSIQAVEGAVEIVLTERKSTDTNWIGEEPVSFF